MDGCIGGWLAGRMVGGHRGPAFTTPESFNHRLRQSTTRPSPLDYGKRTKDTAKIFLWRSTIISYQLND
ncbi:hypothetical protein E2C01_065984 [Portunus trituberculatus]|uniref:Uncharacterized protein n=1 Tax=Portunus trituberculatus TaxID=210409 RepID=A0A5B7HPS6_PORTR|nr:hypothetical protein [Portunus trituberculatus]